MSKKIIKAAELRKKFGGISNTTMHRQIANGLIPPPFKVGRVNAWFEADVDEHLDLLSQKSQ